jgi:hypothetical protein
VEDPLFLKHGCTFPRLDVSEIDDSCKWFDLNSREAKQ